MRSWLLQLGVLAVLCCTACDDGGPSGGGSSPTSPTSTPPSRTVESLSVTGCSVSIRIQSTCNLTTSATFSDGRRERVSPSYTSSDTRIATVSASGLVTRQRSGTTSVSATYRGVSSPRLQITVLSPYEQVAIGVGRYVVTVSRESLFDAPEPGNYYRWHRVGEDLFIQTRFCTKLGNRERAILDVVTTLPTSTLNTLTFDEPFLLLDTVCPVSGFWRRDPSG